MTCSFCEFACHPIALRCHLQVCAARLLRLLLKRVEYVHRLCKLRDVDHPIRAGRISHANLAGAGSHGSHRLPIIRIPTRPAEAEGRLSLTPQGRIRHTLKTPDWDGTTDMVFALLDFIARLAALMPTPRVHLTRYHGVFAPHSRSRAQITLAGRGSGKPADTRTPAERHRAMTWGQRLERAVRGSRRFGDTARSGRATGTGLVWPMLGGSFSDLRLLFVGGIWARRFGVT